MSHHHSLPISTPEAQGISSTAIANFIDAIASNNIELHSFMLLRHGHVIAQGWWSPFAAEFPHMLFSLSKSFASTAVGFAVAEGRLSVDDRVIDFFPEKLPATVSENLASLRVRHLLSMATGHAQDATGLLRQAEDGDWVGAFFHSTFEEAPGSRFVYNSSATYMCSAIVQKLTGMTLLDYLTPRLFEPLGIVNPTWQSCPRGINVGGWGLNIKTADIARFGQMYLQKGVWQGKQLVAEAWVKEATSLQIANSHPTNPDWTQGYGYQFWRCQHGGYRGDGAFGQFCIVLEEQDVVLAITSGQGNMQAVLDPVWTHLLPAMNLASLPENATAQVALQDKLAQLVLPLAQGKSSSAMQHEIAGRKYLFPSNEQKLESVTLNFNENGTTVVVCNAFGEHQIACGDGVWQTGVTSLGDGRSEAVTASGAWVDNTYVALLRFYETPFSVTYQCRFLGNQLFLDSRLNVSFGPLERPQLIGSAD